MLMQAVERFCQGCGAPLTRSPHTSNREWRNKRFCRPGCRVASGGSIAAVEIQHSPEHHTLQLASNMLRDRMFSVFDKVAQRDKLADRWEAAVVCGMMV